MEASAEAVIVKSETFVEVGLMEQHQSGRSHLAGDGSLRKKKFKEFCQFRLNLLIKIYNIPNFKNFWSRGSKVMAKKRFLLFITRPFFVLEKKFTLAIPPKLGKIIGVFEENFFSKVDFWPLFGVANFA